MSGLEKFQFRAHEIRTVQHNGETWFVAADVCRALELGNTSQAVSRLDDDERGGIITNEGGSQLGIINESGLYSLILTSRKPEAKDFKRWITGIVLPSIRRTGSYGSRELTAEEHAVLAITGLQAKIAELEPRAESWDRLADSSGDITVSSAAKMLASRAGIDTGPRRLFDWLHEHQWIYRSGGSWHPYQVKVESGLLAVKIGSYDRNGEDQVTSQVRVTPKGLNRLRELMTPPLELT